MPVFTFHENRSLTFPVRRGQPSYGFEYSTRAAYGGNITWPADAPLNATWWHLVTERSYLALSVLFPEG
jgi:hypothetical protein